jgi:hypothetical protein
MINRSSTTRSTAELPARIGREWPGPPTLATADATSTLPAICACTASTSAAKFGSAWVGCPGISARTTCSGVSSEAMPVRLPPAAPLLLARVPDDAPVEVGPDDTVEEHDAPNRASTAANDAHLARINRPSRPPQYKPKCIRTADRVCR